MYDVGGCLVAHERIEVHDWQVLMLAGNIIMNESVIFEAYVHKDTRLARATQSVRVSGTIGHFQRISFFFFFSFCVGPRSILWGH